MGEISQRICGLLRICIWTYNVRFKKDWTSYSTVSLHTVVCPDFFETDVTKNLNTNSTRQCCHIKKNIILKTINLYHNRSKDLEFSQYKLYCETYIKFINEKLETLERCAKYWPLFSSGNNAKLSTYLGTIQVLCKHIFGLFSPHPPTL